MCTIHATSSDGYSPQWPVDEQLTKIANDMRGRIETQIGKKFDYYQPLVYRRAPYMAPIPGGGGPGPQLTECDYVIKVATKPYTECIHISVHDQLVGPNTGQSLNAFQLTLPLNADLEPIFLPELFIK